MQGPVIGDLLVIMYVKFMLKIISTTVLGFNPSTSSTRSSVGLVCLQHKLA